MRTSYHLDQTAGIIGFEENRKIGLGNSIEAGIASIIAAPIITLLGGFLVGYSAYKWVCTNTKRKFLETKLDVLGPVDFEKLAPARIAKCEKTIGKIKERIERQFEDFSRPESLNLGVPETDLFYSIRGRIDPKIRVEHWKDFSWDNLLAADLSEAPVDVDDISKLKRVSRDISRLKAALNQKAKLEQAPNAMKEVVEFKYIKNGIKLEFSKILLRYGLFFLFPTGHFWLHLFPIDQKSFFDGKRDLLRKDMADANLIAAHNRHVAGGYQIPMNF